VKTRDVRDLVHFDEAEARHETLFETDRVFSQVICLQRNQGLGPMGDPEADAVCLILAGEVAVQVGKGRGRMRQWETVLVPAGDELTVRNASDEPGVILLVTAPPPGAPVDPGGTDDEPDPQPGRSPT
jgi:mannose-6-phosphate isomerase-like protein (cupin superfamily)